MSAFPSSTLQKGDMVSLDGVTNSEYTWRESLWGSRTYTRLKIEGDVIQVETFSEGLLQRLANSLFSEKKVKFEDSERIGNADRTRIKRLISHLKSNKALELSETFLRQNSKAEGVAGKAGDIAGRVFPFLQTPSVSTESSAALRTETEPSAAVMPEIEDLNTREKLAIVQFFRDGIDNGLIPQFAKEHPVNKAMTEAVAFGSYNDRSLERPVNNFFEALKTTYEDRHEEPENRAAAGAFLKIIGRKDLQDVDMSQAGVQQDKVSSLLTSELKDLLFEELLADEFDFNEPNPLFEFLAKLPNLDREKLAKEMIQRAKDKLAAHSYTKDSPPVPLKIETDSFDVYNQAQKKYEKEKKGFIRAKAASLANEGLRGMRKSRITGGRGPMGPFETVSMFKEILAEKEKEVDKSYSEYLRLRQFLDKVADRYVDLAASAVVIE